MHSQAFELSQALRPFHHPKGSYLLSSTESRSVFPETSPILTWASQVAANSIGGRTKLFRGHGLG